MSLEPGDGSGGRHCRLAEVATLQKDRLQVAAGYCRPLPSIRRARSAPLAAAAPAELVKLKLYRAASLCSNHRDRVPAGNLGF